MSDDQPHEMGSRRRRREIREARERARSAQRENQTAVRRMSSSSTAASAESPSLFDQETQTPKDQRSTEAQPHRPADAEEPPPKETLTRRALRRLRAGRSGHQAEDAGSAAAEGSADDPASAEAEDQPASPVPSGSAPTAATPVGSGLPATSSPSTPFDEVLAPQTPDSPEAYEGIEDAEFYAADLYGEEWEDTDEYDHEYVETEVDQDDDAAPVAVGASDYGRGYQVLSPVKERVTISTLKRRRAKRRRRNITLTIALAGFAVLLIGFVVIVRSILGGGGQYDYEAQAGDPVTFEVSGGDGLETVANSLVEDEIIASREAFWDSVNELDNEPVLQPGEYDLREEMPAEDAIGVLFEDGDPVNYISLNAGSTVEDAIQTIAESTEVSHQDLQELNENPQQFGLPEEAESLEGYLAAGEYRPAMDADAEEILEQMVAPTFDELEALGISDEDEQWRTVTIASLITAEANHEQPDDYPLIAGAIENRLQPDNEETDGLLQIDAAVNYGLDGETGLHFTEEDRADESNPYNTYQNPGLPPGPIAAPTADTLEAAANPADTDYFYWVTVNIATGETEFNETYEEHQEDVEEFLRWCQEEDDDDLCGPDEVEAAEDQVNQ